MSLKPQLLQNTGSPAGQRKLSTLHYLLVAAGLAGLALSVSTWPETFLFSKVLSLPSFAKGFPWPSCLPSAWALALLLGPALTAPTFKKGALSLAIVLVGGAALGVPRAPGPYGVSNYLFNVGWVVGYIGVVPLLVASLVALATVRGRAIGLCQGEAYRDS